jgi:hypothetical protein
MMSAVLLAPAIYNRFPLVFPDTGAYLTVAYGGHWTIDRSGFYGLLNQPLIRPSDTALGLWFATGFQVALVAAILMLVIRRITPSVSPLACFAITAATAVLTSLPWHAAQLMPDAVTGVLILVVWLAASRDTDAPGTLLLWLLAVFLATTHYTHLVLLAVAGLASLTLSKLAAVPSTQLGKRLLALLIAVSAVAGTHIAANGLLVGRWTVSPMGSWFIFARLNEDGLVSRWFDAHCGKDGPEELCAIRSTLPVDSQVLLWSTSSPLYPYIHKQQGRVVAWHWIDMMDQAATGSIREQPIRFLSSVIDGAARQFVQFETLDDECPRQCNAKRIVEGRSAATSALENSRQLRDELPKDFIRAVQTPIAAAGLLLMPPLFFFAHRRKDIIAENLIGTVFVCLIANAAVTGGLSDVHDRYQSRIVWLVPFMVLVLAARWRTQPSLPQAES